MNEVTNSAYKSAMKGWHVECGSQVFLTGHRWFISTYSCLSEIFVLKSVTVLCLTTMYQVCVYIWYMYIYHYNRTSTFNLVASYANIVINICRKIKMELINIIN